MIFNLILMIEVRIVIVNLIVIEFLVFMINWFNILCLFLFVFRMNFCFCVEIVFGVVYLLKILIYIILFWLVSIVLIKIINNKIISKFNEKIVILFFLNFWVIICIFIGGIFFWIVVLFFLFIDLFFFLIGFIEFEYVG